MRRDRRVVAGSAALAAATLASALVVCEAVVRFLDGYPITSLRLPAFPPPPPAVATTSRLADFATRLGPAPDVDPRWIDEPPVSRPGQVDRELLDRRASFRHPEVPESNLSVIWNARWVREVGCSTTDPFPNILPLLPMPLQVFDSPEQSPYPRLRYHAGRTTPQGLTTNRLGFRGPDVPLDKGPGTVRIAFVGASTTLGYSGYPFSYPECVAHWLNRWAERAGFAVRFDVVNAGRVGVPSTDIAAIVRQEVAPLEPDLTVYYEGANQFVFFAPLVDMPAAWSRLAKGAPPAAWDRLMAWPRVHSALARRVHTFVRMIAARGGREPAKPRYALEWPVGVDEQAPDITRPDLPLALPVILDDLESIRRAVEAGGGDLAVASFVWLAHDGLRLDPLRQGMIYEFLNTRCWPYRYADIRRLVDFQNRVFRQYADAHGLLFVDVARAYPSDPELFSDAIHFNEAGTRLQAWIVLQALLPHIRQRPASGAWPRPDRAPLVQHPALEPSRPLTLPCAR